MKKSLIIHFTIVFLLIFCLILGKEVIKTDNNTNNYVEIPIEKTSEVTFLAVGDILMEQGMYDWIGTTYDMSSIVSSLELKADLMYLNQESVLGGEELGVLGSNYTFNAPHQIGSQFIAMGFNMISLANNHSLDMGIQGIINTYHFLESYNNIVYSGMAYDQNEKNIIEINGITFGFLSYTSFTNVKDNMEYVNYSAYPYTKQMTEETKQQMKDEIERLRPQCDILIVSNHWGSEFTYEIDESQKEMANYFNQLNVDVVIGGHSHCIQPIEMITNEATGHNTLVTYSLGNFMSSDVQVSDSNPQMDSSYNMGGILSLTFVKNIDSGTVEIKDIVLEPFINHYEDNYTNFRLYLLKDYSEELASKHYRNSFMQGRGLDYYMSKESLINDVKNVIANEYLNLN